MKQYYLTACVGVLLGLGSLTARAQADFEPGYVVRPSGDTVRGEVDYRDARANAKLCRFRATPQAAITTFQPTDLLAYGLHNEHKLYRALTLPTPAGLAASRRFLEVLASGPANLYLLRDEDGLDHYYVATAALPLTELVHRKVLQERIMQEQNIFRTTLSQALVDCPVAQAQLPSLAFTTAALIRVVAAYNQCIAPLAQPTPVVPSVARVRQRPHIGILVGGQRTTMHVQYAQSYTSDVKLDFGPRAAPVVGVSFNVPLTALSRKLSLEAELFYEGEHYDEVKEITYVGGVSYKARSQYSLAMKYLRLPLLVRYTLPKGRARPFLEVGPTLAYAVQLKNEVAITDYYGRTGPPQGFFPDSRRALQEGLAGGIGVQASYWQGRLAALALRAEADTGWTGGQGLDTWSNRFYLLLTLGLDK